MKAQTHETHTSQPREHHQKQNLLIKIKLNNSTYINTCCQANSLVLKTKDLACTSAGVALEHLICF